LTLTERDRALLGQLGFFEPQAETGGGRAAGKDKERFRETVDKLNMRQLDRLKMLLLRNASSFGSDKDDDDEESQLLERIRKNDLEAFAEAIWKLLDALETTTSTSNEKA
jgi:DNA-binding GntR family transcriptional regulator